MSEHPVSHNDLNRFEEVLNEKFKNVNDKLDMLIKITDKSNERHEYFEDRVTKLERELAKRPTIMQLLTACAITATIVIAIFQVLIT